MDRIILVITLAFLLDAIIGDPQNPLHPVCLIGNLISAGVKSYEKTASKSPVLSFIYGAVLSVIVIGAAYVVSKALLGLLYSLNYWAGFLLETVLCYFIISAKALKNESMKVYFSLEKGDITESRVMLSRIVGRDTGNLSASEVIKAAVETVAENFTDGVAAPILFTLVGGAPLGLAYKAVNTLDSMVGYRNEKYEYFGKFAARLDDAANFIPARISALLLIVSTLFTTGNTKRAIKTYIKDRNSHKSPNSAQTEAVCAGALGIQLGGDSYYKGQLVHKPTIGEACQEAKAAHIPEANRLMYGGAVLLIVAIIISWFVKVVCKLA